MEVRIISRFVPRDLTNTATPSSLTTPAKPVTTPVTKGADTTSSGIIGEKEHKFKEDLETLLKQADEKIAELTKLLEKEKPEETTTTPV